MFNLTFSPQFANNYSIIVVENETLWIDGDSIDFTDLPEGHQVEVDHPDIIEPVSRVDGKIFVKLVFRHLWVSHDAFKWPDPAGYDVLDDGVVWYGPVPDLDKEYQEQLLHDKEVQEMMKNSNPGMGIKDSPDAV